MAISKTPTRSHGAGGSDTPTLKKPSIDKNIVDKDTKESRTKVRHNKEQSGTSEVDIKAANLSTE